MKNITVLSSGLWGTVLTRLLSENGYLVKIWNTQANNDNDQLINNDRITISSSLEDVLSDNTDIIVLAVSIDDLRSVCEQANDYIKKNNVIIVHTVKGLEKDSNLRASEVIAQTMTTVQEEDVVSLVGPGYSQNLINHDMTLLTAASDNLFNAQQIQKIFSNEYLRVYADDDLVGVELAAALKNVISLSIGIANGLDYSSNTIAALITRGLSEMARFGQSFGANPITFSGLASVGDLFLTTLEKKSRNWIIGYKIGKNKNIEEILADKQHLPEGISTVKAVYELSNERNIDMPITQAIYDLLYNRIELNKVIDNLINREEKLEFK